MATSLEISRLLQRLQPLLGCPQWWYFPSTPSRTGFSNCPAAAMSLQAGWRRSGLDGLCVCNVEGRVHERRGQIPTPTPRTECDSNVRAQDGDLQDAHSRSRSIRRPGAGASVRRPRFYERGASWEVSETSTGEVAAWICRMLARAAARPASIADMSPSGLAAIAELT